MAQDSADRGLVRPVNHCPVLDGEKVLNGAFGVAKPDKMTAEGEPVLRLIMDLRATNYCMKQIDGDVGHLCGATSFQRIVIESGEELLVSGEDLTAAFYLFARLCWVLQSCPMGWHPAVGLMQACHRTIALKGGAHLAVQEVFIFGYGGIFCGDCTWR